MDITGESRLVTGRMVLGNWYGTMGTGSKILGNSIGTVGNGTIGLYRDRILGNGTIRLSYCRVLGTEPCRLMDNTDETIWIKLNLNNWNIGIGTYRNGTLRSGPINWAVGAQP